MHALTLATVESVVPSWLNTAAITGFFVFIASMLALFLGVSMMGKSRKGNLKEAAAQSGVSLIGLFWVAIGVGGTVVSLAVTTVSLFIR